MTALEFHDYANLFDLIEGQEFSDLVEDVRAHGVREPVWLYEGKILDGRNRYRAAQEAGVTVPTRIYIGNEPLEFVLSLNLHRRHLTPGGRAVLALRIETVEAKKAKERQGTRTDIVEKIPLSSTGQARDIAAKVTGANPRYVQDAKKIARETPDILQALSSGRISIPVAKDLAALPENRRAAILEIADEKEQRQEVTKARAEVKREERISKIVEISNDNAPLATDRKYPVIYADPPWRYEHSETEARAIENQYPTMELADICAMPVTELATKDAILFMWTTAPKIEESLKVLAAWGFTYKSCAIWDKQKIGMGYYFRVQHEILMIATRGNIPTPEAANRPRSVISIPYSAHSSKPHEFYGIIEVMYPELAKIELFCRTPQPGWAVWGNQSAIPECVPDFLRKAA